ncbi:MAG TPA: flagellar basal body-associated FliL family protein [Hyphomonadaceae bacterium]|nr:flagellar basal body-associated FliL family protein [Hyphomonadaceae bacterium]HPI49540.1 flagellar basal body-associated FliL family protein [Hyphomonadaceae bacterium]
MAKKEKAKKPDAPEAEKPAEGEQGVAVKKKMAGKTLVLFIILPAVLVLGGGGAAAMMLLGGGAPAAATESAGEEAGAHGEPKAEEGHGEAKAEDHGGGEAAAAGEHGAEGGAATGEPGDVGHALECSGDDPCYYAMPKLIVNLAGTEGQRSPYMELELTLESSSPATFKKVPELMPRLKDQLNSFLRELRVEDLNGSTGTWRLRRELLNRFNTVMDPKKVDAVLIESMLIQ